ncbi:hypothetical protein [Nocardia heshunensis]
MEPPAARMPSSVRAAQVISLLFGGLSLLATVLLGVFAGADASGTAAGRFIIPMVIGLLALGFGSAGNGLRGTVAMLATLEALVSLGSVATKHPPGFLGLIASIAIVCALTQGSAAEWFKRPR